MLTRRILETTASELVTLAEDVEDSLIAAKMRYLAQQYRVLGAVLDIQLKAGPLAKPGPFPVTIHRVAGSRPTRKTRLISN